jgi:hypothetical protein
LSATTLTAASANASFPVTNLATEFLQEVYKTGTSATAEYITIDLGSSKALSSIIIAAHDLLAADNLRYKFSDASDFSGATEHQIEHVSGTIVVTFPEVEARYVRILFDKASAGDTRQIGRLFVGPHRNFGSVIDYAGFDEGKEDLSRKSRTLGGQVYAEVRSQYSRYGVDCSYVEQEKTDWIIEMSDYVGTHTSFFLQVQETTNSALNESPIDDVLYVLLRETVDRAVETTDEELRYNVDLKLEEFI